MNQKERDIKEKARLHAIERFSERFARRLTTQQYLYIQNKCKEDKCLDIGAISKNIRVKVVMYKNRMIPVLYNGDIHAITTFLPERGIPLADWIIFKRRHPEKQRQLFQ